MVDVSLLGTGGMMPMPGRFLTSMMIRYNGSNILVDCGEGTQVALRMKGWGFKSIDTICFTHFHADHISGLPGLLLTMGNAERIKPLTLVGPKGLKDIVKKLTCIAPELPFKIEYIEIDGDEFQTNLNGYEVRAFKVKHKATCYGYSFNIPRLGKFDAVKATELNIPVKYWNDLQHGSTVKVGGNTYTPDMVLGPARKGIKITYVTDTRPVPSIISNAMNSDLLICEGMYGEKDKIIKAKEYMHMTFYEAAQIARESQPREMWLTHYSPSMPNPREYEKEVKEIFNNVVLPRDGWSKELTFDKD